MKLVEIDPQSNDDIEILYNFLSKRKNSISHEVLPTFENHKLFVENNPYRKWFFIVYKLDIIGSIYVLKDNGIGIDIKPSDLDLLKEIIDLLYSNIKPLEAIPSIRVKNFHINISPDNFALEIKLKELGAIYKQKTYEFRL